MNQRDVVLEVFRNRGWLSLALVSALLDDAGFRGSRDLMPFERAGLLLCRRLAGGMMLFRATRAARNWVLNTNP